nr:hypothetical protein BaRGS_005988 [Batillaria attramentaria]
MQRVSESTFGPGTRQRLQSLDISGNPFQCSRRLSWFCHWLKDDPDLFNVSRRSYQCANKPNVNVTSVCSGGAVHVVFAQLVNDATLSMIFGGGLLVVLHNSLSATAVGM